LQQLDTIIKSRDEAALDTFEKPKPAPKVTPKKSGKPEKISGVRRYLSTDGYEILVGRAARDNDNLTFRVAQPNDLWMHTGDYPGSHVVVRNPTRKEIPHRTIIEAAQLAGKFSQASGDAKVVVHYTERKFLSKPKGAAPGLVRLSRFRSITVEPKESIPRL
jgi:predicted ribosome quality control (RQC) complex YloA/Tae2 family protein